MMDTPNQIIKKLDQKDRKILNSILSVEKKKMHIQNIKKNSSDEKSLVTAIVKIVDEAITNVD